MSDAQGPESPPEKVDAVSDVETLADGATVPEEAVLGDGRVGTLGMTIPKGAAPESTPSASGVALGSAKSVAPPSFEGRYEKRRLLGEGGMGSVSLARDRQIGRNVALKVIRPEMASNRRATSRFVREARVQGQLEHPSIVPVHDLGVDPAGQMYFSMKRVKGVTLEDIVAGLARGDADMDGEYTMRRLLAAFTRICLTVDFAHENGVIHRDLKPANVMLGDFGEVYVLDWGLAKVLGETSSIDEELEDVAMPLDAKTAAGSLIGTPGYMPPEQLRGEQDFIGPSADVYALGALLFEILTLEPLHLRTSPGDVIAGTLGGVDGRPSVRSPEREVAPELEAVCVKATALDPKDRYRTARELHDEVEAYLEGERDVELRREMAKAHADRARWSADRARGGGDEIESRRVAMREVGRALALDPESESAAKTLIALLNQPPSSDPPEIHADLQRSAAIANRETGRLGAIAYISMALYLPVLAWLGLKDLTFLFWLYTLAAICAGLSLWTAKGRRPRTSIVMTVMVFSNLMFLTTWPLFGPLVLLPAVSTANTVAFAAHLQGRNRVIAIACGCLMVLVPLFLELFGISQASYAFTAEGLLILPYAIAFEREVPTLLFLAVTSLAPVVTAGIAVGGVRDNLRAAEKRLYLYAWHLRELVPLTARSPTDTTTGPTTPK